MTDHALIEAARADGLELRSNGDLLKLRGPADVVARWKPRIAADKAGILAALADNDATIAHDPERIPAGPGWRRYSTILLKKVAKVQDCTFAPTASSEERVGRFGEWLSWRGIARMFSTC